MDARERDPVCGMEADPGRYSTVYRGIAYAFCSAQCQARFLANPHLYVGGPGWKAPRQQGMEILKKRRLRLAAPLSASQTRKVVRNLERAMGIREAHAEGDGIEITYDLLEIDEEVIEQRLAAIGVELGSGWGEKLRRAFVHYEEECELDNLAANEKHCCEPRRW